LIFPHPPGWSLKVVRTPISQTLVQTSDSGQEVRIRKLTAPRYRYEIDLSVLRSDASIAEFQQITTFLARHAGRYDSFLWQDPEDFQVTAHGFGVGDGTTTTFQLQRTLGGKVQDLLGTWDTYNAPRVNYATYSSAFDNAAWTKRGTHSVFANQAIAPDGTLAGEQVVAASGTGNQGVYQEAAAAGNGAYTASIWLKSGTLSTVQLCVKDWATDTVRTTVTVTLTSGWQRFSVSGTTSGASAGVRFEWNGSGSGNFYAWGAQIETGNSATAYIASAGSTAYGTPAYWPALGDGFEPVYEPIWSTVSIFKDGAAQVPGTDFTLGANGGLTFTAAPANHSALTWSGSYYRRVRSDDDEPHFERIWPGAWGVPLTFESVLP
jgi:hypothetical protein